MLRYFERADEVVGSMGFPKARRNVYLPPTTGLRDWRSALEPSQQAVFGALAGKLLAELDYDAGPRPTARAWLAAGAAHVRWRADRVGTRLRRSSKPQLSKE
jgi:hypothetical protein